MITLVQLRGWNPATLEQAAQELQASLGALSEIGADAGGAVGMIGRGWSGATSERATASIKACVKQADDLAEAVAAARRTLLAAADALYEAKALLADAERLAKQHGMWFTAQGLAVPGGDAALDLGTATTQVKDMVRRALTTATVADRHAAEALRAALAALPPVESAATSDDAASGASSSQAPASAGTTSGSAFVSAAADVAAPGPEAAPGAGAVPPGGGAGMPAMTAADGEVAGPGAGARVFSASVDGTRAGVTAPLDSPHAAAAPGGHAAGGGAAAGRGGMPMMAGGMGMGAAAAGGAAARATGQYRMVSDGLSRSSGREERANRPSDDVEVIQADDVEVLDWDTDDADDDW